MLEMQNNENMNAIEQTDEALSLSIHVLLAQISIDTNSAYLEKNKARRQQKIAGMKSVVERCINARRQLRQSIQLNSLLSEELDDPDL